MPLSNLPSQAHDTYKDLADELEASFNAVLTIQKRVHEVENQIRNLNRSEQSEEIAKYDQDLVRQLARLSAAQLERQALDRVHTTIKSWIDQLPINARFEDVEVSYCLSPGEDYVTECRTLRHHIDDTDSDLQAILQAVEPLEDLYVKSDISVDGMVTQARTYIQWKDGVPDTRQFDKHPTLLTAWLHPEALKANLRDEINIRRKRELTLGHSVMTKAEQKLQAQLAKDDVLKFERMEEALIRDASAHGTTIPRRENAGPLAILCIKPTPHKSATSKAA